MGDDKRYWEDFRAGEVLTYGARTVDRDEMIQFARQYDPQPFHTDEAAASNSVYGGLIASGWLTCCLLMRMLVDHELRHTSSMGSPGVKALRWLKPVRAGDALSVRHETLSKARHPHRPELGFVDSRFELLNQRGEVVLRMESSGLFLLREPPAAATGGH